MPDTLRVSVNKLRGETPSAHFFQAGQKSVGGFKTDVRKSFRWLLASAAEPRLVCAIEILVLFLLLFNGVGDGFPRTPLPINLRPTTSLAGLGSGEKVWGLGKMM